MLCGTPVVATNLPGVRVPVQTTGMGRIVPCRDAVALAEAIVEVIHHRHRSVRPRKQIEHHFSLETTVYRFEDLFARLMPPPQGQARLLSYTSTPPSSGGSGAGAETSRRDYLSEQLREVPPFRALLRGIECRLFEQAGPLEQPVLDLGCGDGHFASRVFRESLFTGIDSDETMLREAQARGVYHHPLVASATEMPFSDNFFNTVVANCVVEHIPDIEKALGEVCRVLRPEGRFLFGVPSHRFGEMLLGSTVLRFLGCERLARAYGDWFNRHSRHFHTDGPATWLTRLTRHGFTVEHWEYYMSPAGHRAFDLAHYLSVPHLISRKLTGKWVIFPYRLASALFERWLRPHYEAKPVGEGAYLFFQVRRAGLDS